MFSKCLLTNHPQTVKNQMILKTFRKYFKDKYHIIFIKRIKDVLQTFLAISNDVTIDS